MSPTPDDLARQIAELEADLAHVRSDRARAAIEADIAALREQRAALLHIGSGSQVGDVNVGDMAGRDINKSNTGSVVLSDDARIDGVAVGVNLGTIIYGRDPSEDERRRLAWYLHALAGDLRRLPLRGLDASLVEGRSVDLNRIYVMLASRYSYEVLISGSPEELSEFYKVVGDDQRKVAKPEYSVDTLLPDKAVVIVGERTKTSEIRFTSAVRGGWEGERPSAAMLHEVGQLREGELIFYRSRLLSECLVAYPQIVLLGDPGSGKSTFLRHIALVLANRGLDRPETATTLPGWDDKWRLLPLLLPLRQLAGALTTVDAGVQTVFQCLSEGIAAYGVRQPDDLLTDALVRGAAIVLLDGLDEIPITPTATSVGRLATLRIIRAFAERYGQTSFVLTCRTRAFTEELRACLEWPIEMLAPFTRGQIRHFIPAWYAEFVAAGQLTDMQAHRLSDELVATIDKRPRLQSMAETPLLLTMMALVLFNKGELPRDRPQLYERILELLLGEWDKVRDGQNLAEAVGVRDWGSERFQPLLDQISYEAHLRSTSQDGRGRLSRGELRDALIAYFEAAEVADAWGAAKRCLDYFEQRSGLVAPDGPQSYVFAHLTLQEHCAGRHVALNSEDPVALVLQHRADDRWREPIFLGAGLLRPAELNSLLADLIDREEANQPKEIARWYRDLILAAEIGNDRDWSYLRTRPMVKVDRLQRNLRAGLAALLNDPTQPLPTAERVRAGFLLGDLGDPRFPVTIEEWRHEIERARAGDTSGYFCRVEPGEYIIGSSDDDPDADDTEKPQHRFTLAHPLLIARYPITNAQWQAWAAQGGQPSYRADDPDHNRPNQAIVGVSQRMGTAFCAWLTEHLTGELPPGCVLRLPSEQEWEAANRGGDARRYPWGDDWHDDRAATEEDRETRGWRWNLPVGCYPAGAAPCGALDMAGNVWEWTASVWQSYPGAAKAFTDTNLRVLRGGSYRDERTYVRHGTRDRNHPDYINVLFNFNGFRIVVAPPLAH